MSIGVMSRFLALNSRLYAALLDLYPSALRSDFGEEMIEVFAADLADSWKNGGAAGLIRVWWRTGWEIIHVALPCQAANPAIAVPFLSFVVIAVLLSSELILARGQRFDATAVGAVLLSGTVAACTSLGAVCAGNRSLPAPLRMGPDACSKSAI